MTRSASNSPSASARSPTPWHAATVRDVEPRITQGQDRPCRAPWPTELLHLEPSTLPESAAHRFSPLVSWLVATTRPARDRGARPRRRGRPCSRPARRCCGPTPGRGAPPSCSPPGPDGAPEDFRSLVTELSGRFGNAAPGLRERGGRPGRAVRREGRARAPVPVRVRRRRRCPTSAAWLRGDGARRRHGGHDDGLRRVVQLRQGQAARHGQLPGRLHLARADHRSGRGAATGRRRHPDRGHVAQGPVRGGSLPGPVRRADRAARPPAGRARALGGGARPHRPGHRPATRRARGVPLRAPGLQGGDGPPHDGGRRRPGASSPVRSRRRVAEREHLVGEFLDRVDHLSSKVSTTASRYSAELADKDALLEAQERRLEVYAGHAANAQSIIDDMHRSTSWRVTAPVRLLLAGCSPGGPRRHGRSPRTSRTPRWSQSPIPSTTTSRSSSSTTTRRRPRSNASMRWPGRGAS